MRARQTPRRRASRARLCLSLTVFGTLALALGLHAAAQTPLAQCPGGNLLPNPGFESGVNPWYVNGSVSPTTDEAQSGAAAIRLGAPDADGYIEYRFEPVVGAAYVLSGWGKLSGSGEQGTIGVLLYDSNGERLSAAEPAPLIFTDTTFVEQELSFVAPDGVSDIYVYLAKEAGEAQFFADSLSLLLCQAELPMAAASLATPVAAATPIIPEAASLAEFVDPDLVLTIGYPNNWRRLTEEEIRAQLNAAGEDEAAATLATTRLVVVSPDGQAAVALTVLPRSPEDDTLAAVAQAVAAADAQKVLGAGEITTETVSIAGREAMSLSFTADDAAGGRQIRQLVTVDNDATIVLAFVVQRDAAAAYEAIFQQIAVSWRWEAQP